MVYLSSDQERESDGQLLLRCLAVSSHHKRVPGQKKEGRGGVQVREPLWIAITVMSVVIVSAIIVIISVIVVIVCVTVSVDTVIISVIVIVIAIVNITVVSNCHSFNH